MTKIKKIKRRPRFSKPPHIAKLYNSKRWGELRRLQLSAHPLCQCPLCGEGKNRVRLANVVDHDPPHRGNSELFYNQDNLISMAKVCHDKFKQSQERGGSGFKSGVDPSGWPTDPAHWWNETAG